MTTRDVRKAIEEIDARLGTLQPWEATLAARRAAALTEDDRALVDFIDAGPGRGGGRPADADFAPFDKDFKGLVTTREQINELQERRALLAEQRPSKAATAAKVKEADVLAADLHELGARWADRHRAFEKSLAELKDLALDVADAGRQLADGNKKLDKLTGEADIARPETPRLTSTFRIDMAVARVIETANVFHRNA